MQSILPTLSLDLSTRSGWAFHPGGPLDHRAEQRMRFGTWHLDGGMNDPAQACCALLDALSDAQAVHQFRKIVVEAPLPVMSQTRQAFARLAMGLAISAGIFCYRRGLPPTKECNASTVRKAMLGHGFPTKQEIIAWCRARGYDVVDDNAADALVLLHYEIAPVGSAWPTMHKATTA